MSAALEISQNTAGILCVGSEEGATQMTPRNMKMSIVLPEEVSLHCPKKRKVVLHGEWDGKNPEKEY